MGDSKRLGSLRTKNPNQLWLEPKWRLDANASALQDFKELVCRVKEIQHELRAIGAGSSFNVTNGSDGRDLECWLKIEGLLEASEVLVEMCDQLIG